MTTSVVVEPCIVTDLNDRTSRCDTTFVSNVIPQLYRIIYARIITVISRIRQYWPIQMNESVGVIPRTCRILNYNNISSRTARQWPIQMTEPVDMIHHQLRYDTPILSNMKLDIVTHCKWPHQYIWSHVIVEYGHVTDFSDHISRFDTTCLSNIFQYTHDLKWPHQ